MPLYQRAFGGVLSLNPCAGAPTISSVTASSITDPVCDTTGWTTRCTVSLSGSLGGQWELKLYTAIDSGGTAFNFWKRTTSLQEDRTTFTGQFGVGGPGPNTTRWMRFRAEVVPVGTDTVCDGPEDSNQLSKTEPSCQA